MSCLNQPSELASETGLRYSCYAGLGFRLRQMNPTVSTWDPNYTRISALFAQEPMEDLGHAQSNRSMAPREFFLPVEVYISNQAAAALRKVPPYLFRCGVSLIQRTRNSPIHARGLRRESRRDLCPCYTTIVKERLKVCGPATVARSYPVLCFDSYVPRREVKLVELGTCPGH
jgi:hypothetical protein